MDSSYAKQLKDFIHSYHMGKEIFLIGGKKTKKIVMYKGGVIYFLLLARTNGFHRGYQRQ